MGLLENTFVESLLRLATDIKEDIAIRTEAVTTLLGIVEDGTDIKRRPVSSLFKEAVSPKMPLAIIPSLLIFDS